MDHVIEGFSFRNMEVRVVLLRSVSDHVKITTNQPRSVGWWGKVIELSKEGGAQVRGGGGVDTSDHQFLVGEQVFKRGSQGEFSGAIGSEGEECVVPGS